MLGDFFAALEMKFTESGNAVGVMIVKFTARQPEIVFDVIVARKIQELEGEVRSRKFKKCAKSFVGDERNAEEVELLEGGEMS